jgi:hypothetical protein
MLYVVCNLTYVQYEVSLLFTTGYRYYYCALLCSTVLYCVNCKFASLFVQVQSIKMCRRVVEKKTAGKR